jgi:hypothetical protein
MRGADVLLPLSCLLLAVAGGCATLRTYDGPRLGPTEVAVLKPATSTHAHVVLEEINGRELGLLQDRAEVLPGPLDIVAVVILTHGERTIARRHEFAFTAEAGETYTLSADWFLYGPRIRVADENGDYVAQAVTRPDLPHVGARLGR